MSASTTTILLSVSLRTNWIYVVCSVLYAWHILQHSPTWVIFEMKTFMDLSIWKVLWCDDYILSIPTQIEHQGQQKKNQVILEVTNQPYLGTTDQWKCDFNSLVYFNLFSIRSVSSFIRRSITHDGHSQMAFIFNWAQQFQRSVKKIQNGICMVNHGGTV